MSAPSWLRHSLLALAAVAATPAVHATNTQVLVDSIDELKIDWSWDDQAASYLGTHWRAWFTPTWNGVDNTWLLGVSYQHLDGPHGELTEQTSHLLPALVVAPKEWAAKGGVDDHLPLTRHPLAHTWSFGAVGATQSQAGWAALDVKHPVPEPGTWLMLAGGLAALGVRAARRR